MIRSNVGRENPFERSVDEGSALAFAKGSRGKILPAGAVTAGRDTLLPLEQGLLEAGGRYSGIGVLCKRAFHVKLG